MTDAVFLSGWAGPETLFPGLSERVRFVTPFLDGDEATLLATLETHRTRLLAGWSTGAHMIVKHAARLLPLFERVVLVAPFLRFADSFPPRVTRTMAAGLRNDPEGTTRAFWKNCGIGGDPPWQADWAGPLAAGLAYLLTSAAPGTPVPADHVTILHGRDDRIVRRAAVEKVLAALPGARLVSIPGGHYPDAAALADQLF
mgnify:CR=1 FL=1